MNVTAGTAYQLAKNELTGFRITGCYELSDRFLFGWCHIDGTAVMLPPVCVLKDTGEVCLHDEMGVVFLNNSCREQGKEIPLNQLETAQQ